MQLDVSLYPSWLSDLLSAPAAVRLGWVCIHSLWQALAVAVALAVALRLMPRQSSAALAARYRLAVAALATLPLAAVATFCLVTVGVAPDSAVITTSVESAPAAAGFVALPGAALLDPHSFRPDTLRRLTGWLPLVALVWTFGAALAAVRMASGWWITRRLVARAFPAADARLQERVNHWRQIMRIDAAVRVLASAAVETPVVVGCLKPVILWPAAALFGMPAYEIDAIVAHELAHVRRHDALMNLLQACIDVLFFHHPAAWWISRQVRAEREHCADDLAVRALEAGRAGTRLSYARALLGLEERRQAATLSVAANGGRLLDRIRRLAGQDVERAGTARLLAASLTAAALLAIAVLFTAPRLASADDPPVGTNTIESLTPEQAKILVEEWPKDVQFMKVTGRVSVTVGECLALNSLKTLGPATARALAGWEGNLFLDGLTELDAETATALAEFKGSSLSLDGLKRLDADVAKTLAKNGRNMLFLNGLTALDADTAQALAGNGGTLFLSGLTTLDADTATPLAAVKGALYLDGLTALDIDTAKVLAKFSGNQLWLNGLTSLDPDAAEALAECTCVTIGLEGLTSLKPKAAEKLAGFRGELLILQEKVQKKVKPLRQKIFPDSFTPEYPLTPERALTCKTGPLTRLTALESPDSVEIAKALATREGPLALPNLKRISPKTLTALLQKADVEIPPIETLELIQEPDGSPTEDFVIPEGFELRQKR